MTGKRKSVNKLLDSLHERAKELNCLYAIEELLNRPDVDPATAFKELLTAIPPGMQYPDICSVQIVFEDDIFQPPDFEETPWVRSADIIVQERPAGSISVYYGKELPPADDGPFLKEESRLIKTIADRLGHFLLHYQLKQVFQDWETTRKGLAEHKAGEWRTVLELLRQTDRNLFIKLSHKMLNYLSWSGVAEAEKLLQSSSSHKRVAEDQAVEQANRPYRQAPLALPISMADEIFQIAAEHMTDDELVSRLQKWIQEDKLSFLVQVVNRNVPLSEVADAVRRFHHVAPGEPDLTSSAVKGITVSLIRRFLSDQLDYINVAKNYIKISDFHDLLNYIIFAPESHGKLGGKSAGLYLASQIVKKGTRRVKGQSAVKVPKTWHVSSDMLLDFMHYNNLDEIVEQKYKPIDQVRLEYPHIVRTFKNSAFPTEMIKGLSMALDDFGDGPLIVRSSSLLEDRVGAAFSGKYKSLFLANQGSKRQKLDALLDAIAEVYASTFGPDPIEYRAERGLIDFAEEMAIMIQKVVGSQVGDYFLPPFAGVVFSRNEFRWSPRINREDGLVRMVPGLGTRAVDRLSDDYPILMAPGQPQLRVNTTTDDVLRYSPKRIDVIDLKKNVFETVAISDLLKKFGYQFPQINQLVSIHRDGHLHQPLGSSIDFDEDDVVVTFEGLFSNSTFIEQIREMMAVLEEELRMPVDVEFAHDGRDLYLLQCRAQSRTEEDYASPIPHDTPQDKIVFSANRYVSNGRVPDISHIVYIDPEKYSALTSRKDLAAVGQAVGQLNKVLPKRQFILMGPGRWGSRGDIKLGVNVTYSQINNTAVLIELARKKGNYVPDLSFGTHFFQDLVEARIRYLPLYPDDESVVFNEKFLTGSPNMLPVMLPEFSSLGDTVRLIDVASVTDGSILRVLMNAELGQAVGILADPSFDVTDAQPRMNHGDRRPDGSWRWRMLMAEHVAAQLDPKRFGVKAFYVIGSTKNATAGDASDIDILLHLDGTDEQRKALQEWLEGWSLCLDHLNYLRTGYRSGGLLDAHFVTDEDITKRTSYAAKIDAVTDTAKQLSLGTQVKKPL
ncbi:MAG TPA: PEP/pyruvate-binding domain-containing protein [Acidobacteriota bacterium]|nr:PEP/pyruvate-binding domain-containing protein [Acidobacteriota bacterium]